MPTLTSLHPAAALPGAEIEVHGASLTSPADPTLSAEVSGVRAVVTLARPTRATLRIPEGTLPGDLVLTHDGQPSNPLPVHVAVAMAENLNPVASPAVDAFGNVYATLSGSRGTQTPVSVFRIAPAPPGVIHTLAPYARNILNPSGLAFGPDGLLYVSSRADGIVYRLTSSGEPKVFAEGLGIATGIAFDAAGDLYVGDRSGTIFKIHANADGASETFVFATLEPSFAFYHLAFNSAGTLFVSAPNTGSSQPIYAIAPDGAATVFYSGLGRPQGLAFNLAADDPDLYIAASLRGDRGIIRITPAGDATLAIAGSNLVGICFLSGNRAALATRDAVYEITLP